MSLSEKIIHLRKTRGWSQETFAEKMNVSRQAISRWENGTALPDSLNILLISKLFDVTTDYLLREDDESDTAVQTATRETSKKKQLHLIAAICSAAAALCWLVIVVNSKNDTLSVVSCLTLALCAGNAIAQFVLYSREP